MLNFDEALSSARTLTCVDDLARDLWRAHGAGLIADADAERVASLIEEARQRIRPEDIVAVRAPGVPRAALSMFPSRRRRCVSPDRLASRERRRKLGLAGSMPFALAARFTEGERAALAVVAAEVAAMGVCALPLEAIAARAGVCVTLARNAIRLAAAGGLVLIVERRRPGRPNLTNIVRVISREWRAWIMPRQGGRVQNGKPHGLEGFSKAKRRRSDKRSAGKESEGGARTGTASRWRADSG